MFLVLVLFVKSPVVAPHLCHFTKWCIEGAHESRFRLKSGWGLRNSVHSNKFLGPSTLARDLNHHTLLIQVWFIYRLKSVLKRTFWTEKLHRIDREDCCDFTDVSYPDCAIRSVKLHFHWFAEKSHCHLFTCKSFFKLVVNSLGNIFTAF